MEALEREALLKGDVDSLHDKTWADLMPSGAPWPRNLDEPSFCATPGPVKGTRVSRNPDGSPRDLSRPHVSVFDDEDEWNARENAPRKQSLSPLAELTILCLVFRRRTLCGALDVALHCYVQQSIDNALQKTSQALETLL